MFLSKTGIIYYKWETAKKTRTTSAKVLVVSLATAFAYPRKCRHNKSNVLLLLKQLWPCRPLKESSNFQGVQESTRHTQRALSPGHGRECVHVAEVRARKDGRAEEAKDLRGQTADLSIL